MAPIDGNQIETAGAKKLAETLHSEFCGIIELQIRKCKVGDEGMAALAKPMVRRNRCAKLAFGIGCDYTPTIDQMSFCAKGAAAVAESLLTDCIVTDLQLSQFFCFAMRWLGFNNIGSEGGKAVAGMLRKNHTLRCVAMCMCSQDDNFVEKLSVGSMTRRWRRSLNRWNRTATSPCSIFVRNLLHLLERHEQNLRPRGQIRRSHARAEPFAPHTKS